MSRVATIIAGIYFSLAAGIYIRESILIPTGGFIALQHMGSFLATFPVSAPLAMIGFEVDFNNRFVVVLLLASCTGLIYGVVALIGALLCRVSH